MKSATQLYKQSIPGAASEVKYYDRRSNLPEEEYAQRLKTSTTLYVGNLSFFTLESQLLEFFSACGQVINLIMGLNRVKMQPCGFCFVEYATRSEAAIAVNTLNRTVLDGRVIRVDWDYGFEPHRQFGRGRAGGQVRDEVRQNTAAGKGQEGTAGQDSQMKDADRPLVHYSHAKRDYSHHHRNRRDGDDHHGGNHHYGGGRGRGGGHHFNNRDNNDHGNNYGGEGGRNSRYNNNHGDGGGYRGRGGGGYKRNFRDHRNNSYGGNDYRGSTTSADNQNQQHGEYRDHDSEQMGMMSKRRRMNNSSFGGHHHQGNDFGSGNQDNNNAMPFSKSMSMPNNDLPFAQPDLAGQQSNNNNMQ